MNSNPAVATEPASPRQSVMLLAIVLFLVLAVTLALRSIVSIDALAPAVASLLFVMAAATGLMAMLWRRNARRARVVDIAAILTFIGVVVSIMIESDQMMRLMALSDQPD